MKSSLLIIGALLFAASANAQHHSAPAFTQTSTAGGQSNPGSSGRSGGGDGYGYGSGYSSGSHSGYGSGGHLSAPSHALGQTTNDAAYIPTILMDYDKALELGKRQLAIGENAAPAAPGSSLADVARAYRAARINVSGTAPTGLVEGNTSGNSRILNESTGNSATSASGPALADVAREFRALRNIVSPAHAFAVQDNSGHLHVCDSTGANCN